MSKHPIRSKKDTAKAELLGMCHQLWATGGVTSQRCVEYIITHLSRTWARSAADAEDTYRHIFAVNSLTSIIGMPMAGQTREVVTATAAFIHDIPDAIFAELSNSDIDHTVWETRGPYYVNKMPTLTALLSNAAFLGRLLHAVTRTDTLPMAERWLQNPDILAAVLDAAPQPLILCRSQESQFH